MEFLVIIVIVLCLLALLFLKGFFDEKKYIAYLKDKITNEFGKLPTREYSLDELERIKSFYTVYSNESSLDDISANDVDFDKIFTSTNFSKSELGDSYYYYRLRTPLNVEEVAPFEQKVDYLMNHDIERTKLSLTFCRIGKMRSYNLFDVLDYLEKLPSHNTLWDYMAILALAISVAMTILFPTIGVFLLVCVIVVNIVSYYKKRGKIEPYIISFSFIRNFIKFGESFVSLLDQDIFPDEFKIVKEDTKQLKSILSKAKYVVNNNSAIGSGNPLEILGDYIRMIFHVDIITFYRMLNELQARMDKVRSLYITLGSIEALISVANLRKAFPDYCIPTISDEISMQDGYHFLLEEPVKNSIRVKNGVLITGSNASGKSTFLKTVELNMIFSQNIHMAFASSFSMPEAKIFSSMSLRDNLLENDSYFMVEIKAIKRILDYHYAHENQKIICFVDEVLRGTNTVERISASTKILEVMARENMICFAATHDGELTYLLEDFYSNFHFEEEIKDDDVYFNYLLKEGRSHTRNAILLLSCMGFPDNVVSESEAMAKNFVQTGEWKR